MKFRRLFHKVIHSLMMVLTLVWPIVQPLHLTAADFYWDSDANSATNNVNGTGLGGNGTWNTATLNWWPVPAGADVAYGNGTSDRAIFTRPSSSFSALTVNVTSGIQANQLSFLRSGYTLSGGDITLSGVAPSISVNFGEIDTINSQLLGSAGLTKTGSGAVRLTNSLNSYTGNTTISNGSVIITNGAALGIDPSTILVSGSSSRGLGGGALVLQGGYGSGVTLARNVSLQGLGPLSDRSSAFQSVRDNTVTGVINSGVGSVTTRINSVGGQLNLAGRLDVGGTVATTQTLLGGLNQSGTGSYLVSGNLTGSGILEKSGSGTLILSPSSSAGFSGTVRLSSSASNTISSVRIDSANVLGTRTALTTGSVLDFNGGTLEVRMDTPSILAGNALANIYHRANTSSIFLDHSVGGSAINGNAAFGVLAFEENLTLNLNGRNGYGATFAATLVQGGTANSAFNNNLNGNLTFPNAFWNNSDNTASRTFTLGGNGNTFIATDIVASAAAFDHNFTKAGTGTLTIGGNASTLDGNVNLQAGTLSITDFRAINNAVNTTLSIGSGTTTGTLLIRGNDLALADLTSNRTIDLPGSTGGATIIADQSGTSPGMVLSRFTVSGGNTTQEKNLTLGGSNKDNNIVSGVIPFNVAGSVVSVVKNDPGTWVLAGSNTYTGNTTITEGTLEIRASIGASNIIQNPSYIIFDANSATQAAGGTLQLRATPTFATLETLGNLTAIHGATTVGLIGSGNSSASLRFLTTATPGKGSGVNFDTSMGLNGTISLVGVLASNATRLPGNGHFYINGSNFARSNGTILLAPVYGTDAGFVNAPTALVAGNHNLVTGNISAQPARAITSLKMTNNTLNLAGLLTVNTGGSANDGGILIDGNSTISGAGGLTTGGNGTLVYRVEGIKNTLSLATPMTATNAGGFTKNGEGTLLLTAANAQPGATTINEGIVRLSGNGTLSGSGAALMLRQDTTLDIGGVNTGLSIGSFSGSGTVTNNGTAATLTVGNGNGAGLFTGLIQDGTGRISVTKTGTGGQTWSGFNTYTGVTTIGSTGLVSVPNLTNIGFASGIGPGNASANAASLVFNGTTGGIAYSGLNTISIDRLFTLNGNSSPTLSGGQIANNSANQSALVMNNPAPIVFGPNATVPQILTLGGSSTADNQFNPQIIDNGALKTGVSKIGTGLWVLSGLNNTYTGNTTIGQGTLVVNQGTSLPIASGLVFGAGGNAGVLQTAGNFTRNLATAPSNNTVTWNTAGSGGGFAANDSKLVVAIGGLAAPTSLTWGAGGFMGIANSTQTLALSSATALGDVEFRNNINIGNQTRTIQVDDNTNTATDFATMTGSISGVVGGNLTKTGNGILQLLGSSSYVGNTNVDSGTLVVTSLGNSAVIGNSSVGANAAANTLSRAVTLGNGTSVGAILQYVGTGERSDRLIRLNTTTASNTISADGSGPLILTNVVNDMVVGNKTLLLRGSNTQANTISSNLADNTAAGNLSISVDAGATWVLSGNNSYTGLTSVTAGALGIGSPGALGNTAALSLNNGNLFASGADATIPKDVRLVTNTSNAFSGDYNLTISNPLLNQSTANTVGMVNMITTGKALILNGGITADSLTSGQALSITGTGDTIVNGPISTATGFNFGISYTGTGNSSLTLAGPVAAGNALNNGTLTISSGTLKLGASEVIPHGGALNNVVINPGTNVTAKFDLRGFNETINGLTATSAGTIVIDNSAPSTNSTFAVGASDQNTSIGGSATGNYSIQNSGASSTLGFTKVGAGNATITAGVGLNYSGSTTVTGGRLSIASPLNGTSGLNVTGVGSSLNVSAGITSPASVKSVNVGSGSTLNLVDNSGSLLGNLTSLTLGESGGTNTTLNLNAGDLLTPGDSLRTDQLSLLAGGTLGLFAGNTITFNITDTGLNGGQQYVLLNSASGGFLSGPVGLSNYLLNPVIGFTSASLSSSTDNKIMLSLGSLITGSNYFTGTTDNSWNGNVNNWSTDKAGTSPVSSIPGSGVDVKFRADNAVTLNLNTTLEQNFRINSLTFEASTNPAETPNSIRISSGAVAGSRLEVAPQSASDGVSIASGGTGNVTIAAPFRIGANQTWNVSDAASRLVFLESIQGAGFDISKTGSGRVTLSGAADAAFNLANTADVVVNAGALEMLNTTALGSTANSNLARIAINTGGAFYYNNTTASTVANNLTLDGGTLSAGGTTQSYSGAINVVSNSRVNMRDSNAVLTNANSRAINLTGVISGTGKLIIDSNNTLTAGNTLGSSLTISGNNTDWSGGVEMIRGTVFAQTPTSLGTGSHTFAGIAGAFTGNSSQQGGRMILRGTDGAVSNYANGLNFNSATIGEYQADNVSANLSANFSVNHSGPLNLGTAGGNGTGAIARFFMGDVASSINLTGGVILNGSSSLSAAGGDADSMLTISGQGITQAGGSRSLAINDEAGAWAVTSSRVAINAAGNYTGGTSLNEGILILGDKAALGTGALTITGVSTVQPGIDLSGSNSVANNLLLSNNLTTAGANNLTFLNNTTLTGGSRSLANSLTNSTLRFGTLNLAEATTSRTLTVTGNGTTIIGNLVNSGANNVLTSSVGSAGSLTVDGNVFLSNSPTVGRTLTINGAGNTTITGSIRNVNGGAGAASNLIKSGTGTLFISNATNTYTGSTTVSGGVLQTTSDNALPINTAVIVNAGNATAILDTNGNSNRIGSLTFGGTTGVAGSVNQVNMGAGTLTLGGNVSVISTGNFTTAPSINGSLNLGVNPVTFNVADSTGSAVDLNVNAVVAGANVGLTKSGNGTMSLNGSIANTYSGVTTVNGGTLVLNKISGVNAIAGNGTLSKVNPQVVINGGSIFLAANEQINDTVFVRVNGGSLDFNGKNETLYNLDVVSGDVNYSGNIVIDDPTWSGGNNTVSSSLTVGFLDISGGNNTVTGAGNPSGGPGTMTIGTATTPGPLNFTGSNNTPTLNLESDNSTPGTLRFRAVDPIDLTFTGTGTSSGLIDSSGTGTNAGRLDLNGSTRNFNINDATGSVFDMTVAAKIIDSVASSGINKNGAGTLVLSGANTYAGATAVNAGILLIDGSTAAGAVTVSSGATLGGSGTIGGITTVSGQLSPGSTDDAGVLSFDQNLLLGSGDSFAWELLSNTDAPGLRGVAGTGFDGVNVAGVLSINPTAISTLDFANPLVDWSDPFWLVAHQWTVFQGSTPYAGSLFATINSPLLDGQGDSIGSVANTGSFSWGTSGNNVVLIYTAVPEPSSMLLTVLGLMGFGLRRSRKSRKAFRVG